ncbi:MAG: GNAT family N-acetyltransferase [Acholeplasma sp.]|nr:GNAT family N-acetyltransferase [Acholeplasma sp.]
MIYETKTIKLKNDKDCLFRSPTEDDSLFMIDFLKQLSYETDYILTYPEECTMSVMDETHYLKRINNDPKDIMIVCEIDGKIAGNCQISFKTKLKNKHRALIAIGIRKAYWRMGIGSKMIESLIFHAKKQGIEQLELEVIESNQRAIGLYEKMGFEITSYIPNAIKLKDGRVLKEFYMVKKLI